jgi:hypothetical protein
MTDNDVVLRLGDAHVTNREAMAPTDLDERAFELAVLKTPIEGLETFEERVFLLYTQILNSRSTIRRHNEHVRKRQGGL